MKTINRKGATPSYERGIAFAVLELLGSADPKATASVLMQKASGTAGDDREAQWFDRGIQDYIMMARERGDLAPAASELSWAMEVTEQESEELRKALKRAMVLGTLAFVGIPLVTLIIAITIHTVTG